MIISAIITGRKNSTLKNKNLRLVNGKPCVFYPIKAVSEVKDIKNFYVSSDCQKLLNYCSKFDYKKILRPRRLSLNTTSHRDVILHALEILKKDEIYPDIVLILLANAPIIQKEWIKKSINIIKKKNVSAVVPVIEDNDKHPFRAKKIFKGFLKSYFNIKKIPTNRQELTKNYFLCHNFWLINVKEFYKNNGDAPWNFLGKKVYPFIIKNSVDIHNENDLLLANKLVKKLKL